MSLWVKSLVTGELKVNCYLLGCTDCGEAMVIDPGGEAKRILEILEEKGLVLKTVVNTHGHFDHIGGNKALIEATAAELMIHEAELPILRGAPEHAPHFGCRPTPPSPEPGRLLRDGDQLALGQFRFEVIHVPGHSPGGICLLGEGRLFSGDSLFAGSIGRTDLPSGDHGALVTTLRRRILTLPEQIVVCPGHGPETTVGRERRSNPFLR